MAGRSSSGGSRRATRRRSEGRTSVVRPGDCAGGRSDGQPPERPPRVGLAGSPNRCCPGAVLPLRERCKNSVIPWSYDPVPRSLAPRRSPFQQATKIGYSSVTCSLGLVCPGVRKTPGDSGSKNCAGSSHHGIATPKQLRTRGDFDALGVGVAGFQMPTNCSRESRFAPFLSVLATHPEDGIRAAATSAGSAARTTQATGAASVQRAPVATHLRRRYAEGRVSECDF